jgi:hypothetical protein
MDLVAFVYGAFTYYLSEFCYPFLAIDKERFPQRS